MMYIQNVPSYANADFYKIVFNYSSLDIIKNLNVNSLGLLIIRFNDFIFGCPIR